MNTNKSFKYKVTYRLFLYNLYIYIYIYKYDMKFNQSDILKKEENRMKNTYKYIFKFIIPILKMT